MEKAAAEGKDILFEAQLGALRDIDYGIYPYTSSSSTIAGLCNDRSGYSKKKTGACRRCHEGIFHMRRRGSVCCRKAAGEEWNDKLRKAGNEFGAATGRPRRVGPFDAVASRYGLQCQNAGDIALTKLDVLSSFEKIPVITGYRVNGKLITDFPTNVLLDAAKPEVEMLDGWNCDISSCRKLE